MSQPPERVDLLIEAGWVVPVEPHGVVLEDHAVAVRDGAIVALLPRDEARARFEAAETVSRPDAALMPGFVNAHTHNPMTLLRGVADDLPLKTWLQDHIWPIEAAVIGPEFVADGVTLAIAEMLRGGTTCVNENYFFPDVQAAVYKRHGFRARVGLPVIEGGRLRNYVFVSLRLHLGGGKSVEQMRPKEAFFRDALVRAAHRTPFTVPGDWTRLDERALSAALINAANGISGRGSVARVEVLAQNPRRRSGMPTGR